MHLGHFKAILEPNRLYYPGARVPFFELVRLVHLFILRPFSRGKSPILPEVHEFISQLVHLYKYRGFGVQMGLQIGPPLGAGEAAGSPSLRPRVRWLCDPPPSGFYPNSCT